MATTPAAIEAGQAQLIDRKAACRSLPLHQATRFKRQLLMLASLLLISPLLLPIILAPGWVVMMLIPAALTVGGLAIADTDTGTYGWPTGWFHQRRLPQSLPSLLLAELPLGLLMGVHWLCLLFIHPVVLCLYECWSTLVQCKKSLGQAPGTGSIQGSQRSLSRSDSARLAARRWDWIDRVLGFSTGPLGVNNHVNFEERHSSQSSRKIELPTDHFDREGTTVYHRDVRAV